MIAELGHDDSALEDQHLSTCLQETPPAFSLLSIIRFNSIFVMRSNLMLFSDVEDYSVMTRASFFCDHYQHS